MHIKRIFVWISLIVFSFSAYSYEPKSADEVLGFWLTQEETAVIEIFKENEKFAGKIVWLARIHNKEVSDVLDTENPEEKLRSRSVLGLRNLENFVYDSDEWNGGSIYDPKSGKTYSAKMTLESENELHLRGYVGVPMFGRTSKWKRQKNQIPNKFNNKK